MFTFDTVLVWWQSWWAVRPVMWNNGTTREHIDFRPTERDAIKNIRETAYEALFIRNTLAKYGE